MLSAYKINNKIYIGGDKILNKIIINDNYSIKKVCDAKGRIAAIENINDKYLILG